MHMEYSIGENVYILPQIQTSILALWISMASICDSRTGQPSEHKQGWEAAVHCMVWRQLWTDGRRQNTHKHWLKDCKPGGCFLLLQLMTDPISTLTGMFWDAVPQTHSRLCWPISQGSGLPLKQMQVWRDNAGVYCRKWIAKAEARGRGTEIRNQGTPLLLLRMSEGTNRKLKLSGFVTDHVPAPT